MIFALLLLAVTPEDATADYAGAAADAELDQSEFPIVTTAPAYQKWLNCVHVGARALSHGPDAADLVARAAMTLCEDEEMLARMEASEPPSSHRWAAEHERIAGRALARVIQHRAEGKIQHSE